MAMNTNTDIVTTTAGLARATLALAGAAASRALASAALAGPGRRAFRSRAQGAARRHPHGGAAAAGRGAAQRLPDHAGGRGAQRRGLASQPRLGLPGAAAARGRGPDPLERGGGGTGKVFELTDAGRAHVQQRDADAPAPWEQMSGNVSDQAHELAGIMREVASAFVQVMRTGSETQIARGPQAARGDSTRPLPYPR